MRHSRLAMVLAGLLVLLAGSQAFAQAAAPPATWSVSDCQACHEKAFSPAFAKSAHAQADQSCANCHENVGEHATAQVAGEANGPVPSLKNVKANELNKTCLTCHEKAGQANYLSSMHARRNVACTSCHSIHNPKSVKASAEDDA